MTQDSKTSISINNKHTMYYLGYICQLSWQRHRHYCVFLKVWFNWYLDLRGDKEYMTLDSKQTEGASL